MEDPFLPALLGRYLGPGGADAADAHEAHDIHFDGAQRSKGTGGSEGRVPGDGARWPALPSFLSHPLSLVYDAVTECVCVGVCVCVCVR